MQIVLVRHALPLRMDTTVGTADPELTDLGHQQAAAAAEFLSSPAVQRIVSSPMMRARQTAAPLAAALNLSVDIDDDLAEYDSGQQSYLPVHEIRAAYPDLWQQMLRGDLPDFVDLPAFRGRVMAAFERIMTAHSGRDVVAVFCHAGVINAALSGYLGIERALPFPVDYASISRIIAARSGRRAVSSVNETAHVRFLLDVATAPLS
jgi:broad specificity phosphatase PhoE